MKEWIRILRGRFEERPAVVQIECYVNGGSEETVLRVAAAVAAFGSGPFCRAILQSAQSRGVPLAPAEDWRSLPSGGFHCWADGLPTLLGPRWVLRRCGFRSPQMDCESDASPALHWYVTQGPAMIGRLALATRPGFQPAAMDCNAPIAFAPRQSVPFRA